MNLQFEADIYTKVISNKTTYSSRGNPTYHAELYHEKLDEKKYIKATDTTTLENRINSQCKKWMKQWEEFDIENEVKKRNIQLTSERESYKKILIDSIDNPTFFDIESYLDPSDFPEEEPSEPTYRKYSAYTKLKPFYYQPKFGFFSQTFRKNKVKVLKARYESKYKSKLDKWQKEEDDRKKKIEFENNQKRIPYEEALKEYNLRKDQYYSKQKEHNQYYTNINEGLLSGNIEYMLDSLKLLFREKTESIDLDFIKETNTLLVDYQLPDIEDISHIKEYRADKRNHQIKEVFLTDKDINSIYDEYIYNLTFSIIHTFFQNDPNNIFLALNLNGWVKHIKKETGHEETICILSIFTSIDDFEKLNLRQIDPKACFRSLKGICSPILSSITPIKPILMIERNDKRFVSSYDIADSLDDSTNLAAMNWEDFEHLVRELFAKEFTQNGGEVNITQASRDGGVDAIAFDPDPIRGGKIVIQAKRYTNVVGVSAVRDLYGTVMNEGANKGILVSTSDYGPDSFEFAKGKPLTLLNGNNLLYLLEKHGYNAKIDIKAAKMILAEQNK